MPEEIFGKTSNAAIQTVFQIPKKSSLSCHYANLHWLNIDQRTTFKIILFVFKVLHCKAPDSTSDLIQIKNPVNIILKENKFFHSTSLGKCALKYVGPRYWNAMASNIRLCVSIDYFKGQLKPYLFSHFDQFKEKLGTVLS